MNILSSVLSKITIEEDKINTPFYDTSSYNPIYTEIETDSPYKWEEITNNGKVLRNNNDPKLTPDGLPTIETQLENIRKLDEETTVEEDEVKYNNLRLKCLILHSMGKSILQDTRFFKSVEKEKYDEIKNKLLEELTQEELINRFNKICHQTIFECGEDVSKYPIYPIHV
jgi:hypothetical protein